MRALEIFTRTGLIAAIILTQQSAHAQFNNPFGSTVSSSRSYSDGTTQPSAPRQGADGVSFLPVPMDTSLNCNSVILRGTQRFQGTAFVLPRVVVSQNKDKETLFEIIQTANGRYLLRFAIYFPRTNEELTVRMSKSHLLLQGCDFDAVLASLNRKADAANKIASLARIPISSVDVRLDGISKPYTLGGVEASILHYQGVDHVVEFPIASRADLEAILARIQGNIGLGIHIAMKFNARAGDGALYANVNLTELAAAIQAGARGRKLIATGELQGMIASNLQKIGMDIQTEAGTSRTFEIAAEQIMNWIVQSLFNSTGGNGGYYQSPSGGWGNSGTGNGPFGNGPFGNGSWGNGNTNNGNTNDPFGSPFNEIVARSDVPVDLSSALSDTDMIQVAAVVQLMASKKTQKIKYENMGPSEQQVYNTSVVFRGELDDPDVRPINIVSGPENARILPNRLMKNSELTLSVASYTQESISYKASVTYLTEAQLRGQKLHNVFPLLVNEKLLIKDQQLKEGWVGTMKQAPQWNPFNHEFYLWGVVEATPRTAQGRPREIALTPQAVSALPIAVSFSRVGLRKFSLGELLKENAHWKGEWDDMGGKILFTAKANLGQMTIYNLEPQKVGTVVQKYYFQEKRNKVKVLARSKTPDQKAQLPVQRSIYKMLVTNGSEVGEVVASVLPEASGGADAPVIIPAPAPVIP